MPVLNASPHTWLREYVLTQGKQRWSHDTLADIGQEFANEVKSNPTRPLTFQGAVFDEFLIHEELAGTRTDESPRILLSSTEPGSVS